MASDHKCQRLIKSLARFTLGTATRFVSPSDLCVGEALLGS